MSLIPTVAPTPRDHEVAGMIYGVRGTANAIAAGSVADGEECSSTTVTNGTRAGVFSAAVDCASLKQCSPDGNPRNPPSAGAPVG